MELQVRKLEENDWNTLVEWWKWWRWPVIPKGFLPDNGTGGLIVYKENTPIVAGFLYFTNSDGVLLEWVISSPEYREKDRKKALELLISTAEETCRLAGKKHMFSIGRNKHLIETHRKLGWTVDKSPSYELIKNI
tara:strand:+ start:54 stop:458 length:405 start_codon:yes stop_codon:yes gene_type:complete